jgi:hypothetical protein
VPADRPVPLAFAAVALWLVLAAAVFLIALVSRNGSSLAIDFRVFYAAGHLLREHPSSLYNLSAQFATQNATVAPAIYCAPFYHPSFEALLYAPFSLFRYQTAYIAYIAFTLLLLLVCYRIAPLPRSPAAARVPRPVLFFVPLPIVMCLVEGQNNVLFLLLMCLIWRCLASNRDLLAGALLAIGLIKLPLVLPIVLLLSLQRGSRTLLGFLAGILPIAALSIALTGWSAMLDWAHLLASATLAHNHSIAAQRALAIYPAAMPSLSGLFYLLGARSLSATSVFAINTAISVSLLIACAVLVRHVRQRELVFSIAILCSILISPHLYLSDLALLLLPLLLLAGRLQFAATLIFCLFPYLVLFWRGSQAFALNAIIPALLLGICFSMFLRSQHRAPATAQAAEA